MRDQSAQQYKTYNDTATKVLYDIKSRFWDEIPEHARSPAEDGEEGAEHGADEDDEDGGDTEACVCLCAAACTAKDAIVVALIESTNHFCELNFYEE